MVERNKIINIQTGEFGVSLTQTVSRTTSELFDCVRTVSETVTEDFNSVEDARSSKQNDVNRYRVADILSIGALGGGTLGVFYSEFLNLYNHGDDYAGVIAGLIVAGIGAAAFVGNEYKHKDAKDLLEVIDEHITSFNQASTE